MCIACYGQPLVQKRFGDKETMTSNLKRAAKRALLIALSFASTIPSHASEFDGCVLENMQGVKSDEAALAIKEACIRTVEKPAPEGVIADLNASSTAYFGALPFSGNAQGALFLTIHNATGYTVTELTVSVADRASLTTKNYVVRYFPDIPPPNVISMGPPNDRSLWQRLQPGLNRFYFEVTEIALQATWHDKYTWQVLAAKGYLDD